MNRQNNANIFRQKTFTKTRTQPLHGQGKNLTAKLHEGNTKEEKAFNFIFGKLESLEITF